METNKKTDNLIFYKIIQQNNNFPWITMVHGFTLDHAYFSKQVEFFKENYNLLLIDLRGHGKSSDAVGPYGIEEYADDIIQIFKMENIKKTCYWGTHTGAAVGMIVALRNSDYITSLILEGVPLPGFNMPRTKELLDRGRRITRESGLKEALKDWFNNADWFLTIRYNPVEFRRAALENIINDFKGAAWLSDLEARGATAVLNYADKIVQPVLVYNGELDLKEFKEGAAKLALKLINVKSAEIPETGGFPAWERPEKVNLLVKDFLLENFNR